MVLGGGISGLAAAWRLAHRARGLQVNVYTCMTVCVRGSISSYPAYHQAAPAHDMYMYVIGGGAGGQ